MFRDPSPTLKIVCSPRRVMVLSLNVNSLRDWTPVCTAVPWGTSSFTAAGRDEALDGSIRTSWMTCVTLASFSSSALTSFESPLASVNASDVIAKMNRDRIFIASVYSGFMQSLPKSDCTASNSRSHDDVIRACNELGNMIEMHEQNGEFKEW